MRNRSKWERCGHTSDSGHSMEVAGHLLCNVFWQKKVSTGEKNKKIMGFLGQLMKITVQAQGQHEKKCRDVCGRDMD